MFVPRVIRQKNCYAINQLDKNCIWGQELRGNITKENL